jgi:hypothetical protein
MGSATAPLLAYVSCKTFSSAKLYCHGTAMQSGFTRGVLLGFTSVLGLKPDHTCCLIACLSDVHRLLLFTRAMTSRCQRYRSSHYLHHSAHPVNTYIGNGGDFIELASPLFADVSIFHPRHG